MSSGKTISKLRRANGFSQAEAARKLNVTRQYLSMVENGRDPGMEFLRAAAALFEVPTAVLMIEEGESDNEISDGLNAILFKVLGLQEKLQKQERLKTARPPAHQDR